MDSRDVAPSLPQSNPDADAVPDLLRRAVSGVLRNAQNGDLPLFAWTLGMPQPELLALQQRLRVPLILITHDVEDAKVLGQHVVQMQDGRLQD